MRFQPVNWSMALEEFAAEGRGSGGGFAGVNGVS